MEISTHETLWLQRDGAKMLTKLGVKKGHSVIDFGCGEGRYTIPLSQIVDSDGCVYAVERDQNAIAVMQERLSLFSDARRVVLFDTEILDRSSAISHSSIDFALVFDVLQYVDDWDALFVYFSRVLKPGGFICIYPAAIPHPGDVDITLVKAAMEKAGFRYVKSVSFCMMHNVDMVEDVVYLFVL